MNLYRFKDAQEGPTGFEVAIRELKAGTKRSHWIWWVFPQLAGLGHSATATRFSLAGPDEAEAYLRDQVLRERLLEAARAARRPMRVLDWAGEGPDHPQLLAVPETHYLKCGVLQAL